MGIRIAIGNFLCSKGWHDWQFFGNGTLAEFMGYMMAQGDQKCTRCGKFRKKSFVVGRARRK